MAVRKPRKPATPKGAPGSNGAGAAPRSAQPAPGPGSQRSAEPGKRTSDGRRIPEPAKRSSGPSGPGQAPSGVEPGNVRVNSGKVTVMSIKGSTATSATKALPEPPQGSRGKTGGGWRALVRGKAARQPEKDAGGRSGGSGRPAADDGPAPARTRPPAKATRQRKAVTPSSVDDAARTVVAFPESPKRKLRRRLLIGGGTAVALFAVLLAVLVFSPVLAVQTVSVSGTDLTPTAQVESALEPLKGKPLPQVSDKEVKALLTGFPAVEDVAVEAKPPSELGVKVIEHPPVALLETGKKFALINADGKRLATVGKRSDAELPLIDDSTAADDREIFRTLTTVLGALPQDVLAELEHASAKTVDSVQLQLTNGKKVIWGNADQLDLKAKVFEVLLKAEEPEGGITVYDVSTPTRPVTK
ncbi:FtsQ-type POTRA domain-containing protein [Arthrobacter sp. Marseille-P9274]|uniref:cell division protein FtsQ/DivIB n=1 Tax=Arthrobacter sp. Marseille-P9274 TaxID=2866572 RepID=UPI0021C7E9FA|nr:FtsQ-type POTRA domain-containing protein [Arthrobacter sp. Marseille-P9274]